MKARCEAYRELFRSHLDPDVVRHISTPTETGTPLGNDRFREQIESVLKRKVGYAKRRRPRRSQHEIQQPEKETPDLFD